MADKVTKKIAMYQSDTEYPSLHIIVTGNSRYWKDRFVCETVEGAVTRITLWLERKMEDDKPKV